MDGLLGGPGLLLVVGVVGVWSQHGGRGVVGQRAGRGPRHRPRHGWVVGVLQGRGGHPAGRHGGGGRGDRLHVLHGRRAEG